MLSCEGVSMLNLLQLLHPGELFERHEIVRAEQVVSLCVLMLQSRRADVLVLVLVVVAPGSMQPRLSAFPADGLSRWSGEVAIGTAGTATALGVGLAQSSALFATIAGRRRVRVARRDIAFFLAFRWVARVVVLQASFAFARWLAALAKSFCERIVVNLQLRYVFVLQKKGKVV